MSPAPYCVMAEIHMRCGRVTIVDDADALSVAAFNWRSRQHRVGNIYALAAMQGRTVALHRWLLDEPAGMHVDHINGDGLDNRRANLRACHPFENSHNRKCGPTGRSQYIGVQTIAARPGLYRAMLRLKMERLHLGYFNDPAEAARVRDYVARALIGDFAAMNFPADDLPDALPPAAQAALTRYGA